MSKIADRKEIEQNVKWFLKFPLEKRLTLAYQQSKAIKILRKLKPKKRAPAG